MMPTIEEMRKGDWKCSECGHSYREHNELGCTTCPPDIVDGFQFTHDCKSEREVIIEGLESALASALEQLETAAKWIGGQAIHEEDCQSLYATDDMHVNDRTAINDERCDCGLREQFLKLPEALQLAILAAMPPAPKETT